jgi:hypothetical protein
MRQILECRLAPNFVRYKGRYHSLAFQTGIILVPLEHHRASARRELGSATVSARKRRSAKVRFALYARHLIS